METELQAWDRQPGETAKAYEAFCLYRDMGPRRSIPGIYRKIKGITDPKVGAAGIFNRWSSLYKWRERAEAYDAHCELNLRREREDAERTAYREELKGYRARQQKIAQETLKAATHALNLIGSRLSELTAKDIPIDKIPQFLRAAAAVAEVATNSEAQTLGVEELLREYDDRNKDGSPGSQ